MRKNFKYCYWELVFGNICLNVKTPHSHIPPNHNKLENFTSKWLLFIAVFLSSAKDLKFFLHIVGPMRFMIILIIIKFNDY